MAMKGTYILVQHREELSERQSLLTMEQASGKVVSFLPLEYSGKGWMCTYQNMPE